MTNEPTGRRHWLPTYAWLPRNAELWSYPFAGSPATGPRVVLALVLIGGQAAFTSGTAEWGVAASLGVILLGVAAWLLRRRCALPSGDGAWIDRSKSGVRLIRPLDGGPGPAVVTEVGAGGGELLDPVGSAAALRAAANLLAAAGLEPDRLQAVGADMAEADDDDDDDGEAGEAGEADRADGDADFWEGDCVVAYDAGAAFVLELGAFGYPEDKDSEDDRERQRALLARVAGTLGVAPPVIPGPRGQTPDEIRVTADDLRAFADAGLASAQRLERQFETSVVDGPSDIALELGRVRAWPSRVDAMPVRALAAADPARIAEVLTEDLAAQAAADRAREQRGEAVGPPVTDGWERRWRLYLERYAAGAATGVPAPEPVDPPPAAPRDLAPTARVALLLAATADDSLRARATGPFALADGPGTRRVRWPGHRRLALVGDRLLLAITVYVIPFTHLWAGTVR